VTREDALSLASCGNISAMIKKGKGPTPNESVTVYTTRLA